MFGCNPLADRLLVRSRTFNKGYIYEYAFSPDGTKLYVARGISVRDAVIIKNF